jgi:predicted nucleic acid-binding protein
MTGNTAVLLVRCVLDTDVMVAAIRSNTGASRHLLVAGLQRRLTLLISVPLVAEYEAVMTRPDHRLAAHLSLADMTVLLDAVVAVAGASCLPVAPAVARPGR